MLAGMIYIIICIQRYNIYNEICFSFKYIYMPGNRKGHFSFFVI